MTHDWDLVERLLLEVRQSAHENLPRAPMPNAWPRNAPRPGSGSATWMR